MSFNIRFGTAQDGENHWSNRKHLTFETIEAYCPDLLGLQEVLAFQADELQQQFDDYEFVGVGKSDGRRDGTYSAIMFKGKRFEKVDEGHFWLSETPDQPGSKSWDSAQPRITTWLKLHDRRAGGRVLMFFNTHWDHLGHIARIESAKLMHREIKKLSDSLPVIVTGDFNSTEDHLDYQILIGLNDTDAPFLIDSYRQVHPSPQGGEGTFHQFTGRNKGKGRIDWILHTAHFKAIDAEIDRTQVVGQYPSDHFPVTAIIALTSELS